MNATELRNSQGAQTFSRFVLIKKFWKILLIQSVVAISVSGIMLNMLGISNIIWPGENFHSFELGIIVSLKMLMVACMGIVFGYFTDRMSRKTLFSIVLFIMGIGKFLNGYVPLFDSNFAFILFIIWYALLGIGQGGIDPLILSYSNDSCESEIRSRFFGINEVFRQFFLLVGMILSAWLIQTGNWRIYFWSTGLTLIITSIFIFFTLDEPKRGIMRHELKWILSKNINYKYKLNKSTIKSTIFSKTNIIAFIEGIFTWVLFSIAVYLIYPYIQSPPYNVSPVVSSLLMIIFGVPGSIIGAITFAKLSDKLAEKNPNNRIYLIVSSLVILFCVIILLFIIPLPPLNIEEANNISNLLMYPIFIIFGILLFVLRAVLGVYNINQSPLLQIINLPEAQGTISAWNQFLEKFGYGLGPLISGYLLTLTNQNYVQTALFSLFLGFPSILLWLLAIKWLHSDIKRINEIMEIRAKELKNEKMENKTN
ncbi:MAG: MFS transporter [Candidatus Helarchaeota archaeon]